MRRGAWAAGWVAAAILAGPAGASAWTPQAASYGVGEQQNVAIAGADGTTLRANVYYPTTNGQPAGGRFPVILTQTPYGKDDASAAGGSSLAELAGLSDFLVQRGYIQVVADVRGTGGSQGEWGLFDPIQGRDGVKLVDYAAALPHSDGDVGLLGASYLGINQFATAADAGPAHVKAMFPIIAGNDLYRDTAFAGGFPDIEFSAFYLGLTGSLNTFEPIAEGNNDLASALTQHVRDLTDFDTSLVAGVETGGDQAFDQAYWSARNPGPLIDQIVRDGIPAFLLGGWYDLFQRGELLNYSSFQNAYDHRSPLAAMSPTQPVTPRYQLIQGPWYHVTAGMGLSYHGLDLDGVELAWFDHWLKGVDTGITDTTTPLHLEDLATGTYADAARYPLDQATPQTYYLQSGGGLSSAKPAANGGSDPLVFTGSQIPCTSSTEQWAAGLGPLALGFFGQKDPCTQSVALSQAGPGTQDYTTPPFTKPTILAGPIGATLYATATTSDTEWVVQISDVAPNGQATALTSGLLEGRARATDAGQSWLAADGHALLPFHPYTAISQQAVTPGALTRYDIEVFPTFDTLQPGHRLRVTVATSDFPHALPEAVQLPNLIGGVYSLAHSAGGPSSVELPLIHGPVGSAGAPTAVTRTPLGCPVATGSLHHTTLGAVRLGMTRSRARAALVDSSTHGRKAMDYFCLSKGDIRVGYQRGRLTLALTANRRYTLLGSARYGSRIATVARHLRLESRYVVGANAWYLTTSGAVRGVLKVRHGVVQEVGIADGRQVRTRRQTGSFLRSFG